MIWCDSKTDSTVWMKEDVSLKEQQPHTKVYGFICGVFTNRMTKALRQNLEGFFILEGVR